VRGSGYIFAAALENARDEKPISADLPVLLDGAGVVCGFGHRADDRAAAARGGCAPAGSAAQMAATFELNGQAALRQELRQVEQPRHLRLFLFDGGWRELSGGRCRLDGRHAQRQTAQAARAAGPAVAVPFCKTTIAGLSGRTYTLVAELPPNPVFFLGRSSSHGWGMLVAVLTSAWFVIC